MKPLLEITDRRYLRRLVRELNDHGGRGSGGGFYAANASHVLRCNLARVRGGVLEVRSPSGSPQWSMPAHHSFTDSYSRGIVASRSVR